MKKTALQTCGALLAGIIFSTPVCVGLAAETNSGGLSAEVQAAPAPVISVQAGAPKLPYGVEDVLKLSRAQISEDIILNYVHNSGTIYNLAPKDIVYLRDQGVSDKVLNAMLDQRKRVELAAQNAQPAPGTVVSPAPAGQAVPDATSAGSAANADQQPATYAEAPLTPPASTVYTIPYAPTYYAPYYYPYSYYYPYYYGGWYGPSVAFGFRFGGHGGFRGGFHGGHSFAGHGGGHHR
jgi:hypothetical protein